jgi:hypothetical protein
VPDYLRANAAELRKHAELIDIADRLEQLASDTAAAAAPDLEALEQELAVLEQKMIALARTQESDEAALESRRELDTQLRPYRAKMTAPQLAMLEQQYRERRTLESRGLPRLSLFYLR